jgi:hypothetical protein
MATKQPDVEHTEGVEIKRRQQALFSEASGTAHVHAVIGPQDADGVALIPSLIHCLNERGYVLVRVAERIVLPI